MQTGIAPTYLPTIEYRSESWVEVAVYQDEYSCPLGIRKPIWNASEARDSTYLSTVSPGKCCYGGWWQLVLIKKKSSSCILRTEWKNRWGEKGKVEPIPPTLADFT
jgi:hypothetical protein